MSKRNILLPLSLLFLAVGLSACTLPWQKKGAEPIDTVIEKKEDIDAETVAMTSTSKLKRFNNYDEVAEFLAANTNPASSVVRGMSGQAAPLPPASADASGGSSEAVTASQPNNSLDYSSTNNQVAGVDEPDIIKNDGQRIYALVKNELSIISAVPAAEAKVISKITFKSRPQDILIDGNFLAVFGTNNQVRIQESYPLLRRQNNYTFFKVFDLSDPVNPKQVRDLDFEGTYHDARLIGDYVYFITDTYNDYVAGAPVMPQVLDSGLALPNKCESGAKCFTPEAYYFDISYNSYNFTNIAAINIKNNGEALSGQSYILDSGQNIYVSQDNIYITYTQYINEYDLERVVRRETVYPKLSGTDQDRINQIEATPSFILNEREKMSKVAQYIDRYINSLDSENFKALSAEIDTALAAKIAEKSKEMEKTVIHKIGVSGNKLVYRAMGEVNGQVLNQFSMDEDSGYFRIATTRSQYSSRLSEVSTDSYSNVYVLDADLQPVGKLENLATTEKIYSARFIGNRAYMVTFKQVDPLYVISLSNPAQPVVLGAIKIPGFSNYLHPADKDGTKMIGLGRETEETADGGVVIKGLKLSLFDFSDLSKPKELSSYILGSAGSDSIALSDHRAFLYSADKNILVIPAALRDNAGRLNFGGAVVFAIDNDALVLKGKIDHSAGGRYSTLDYWDGYNYYDNTAKRSLYIGNNLFTFSNKFLKINSLGDLSEVKSLELTSSGDDYIITPSPAVSGETSSGSGSASGTALAGSPASELSDTASSTAGTLPEDLPPSLEGEEETPAIAPDTDTGSSTDGGTEATPVN